jgi:ABC-type glycerol-3-phosphate transport system substrate-binding protein
MSARSRAWALLLAPTLLLAACGGDGGDGGTEAAAPLQPAKVTVTASATGGQVTFDVPARSSPGRPS